VTLRSQVLAALATVHDPELDEPITALGFVSACVVGPEGDVAVRIRLPTPQCAPNFAYLMAADAATAVRGVPGTGAVSVVLEDHYTGAEINAAVGRGESFAAAFPGETEGDLGALRELFRRKALLARQGRLLASGPPPATLGELSGPDADRCRELRRMLGIPAGDEAAAFVTAGGAPVEDFARFARMARLTALSLEANGGLCRDLLQVRYGKEVAA
jgi:metal-sulfur cluster biosynthetic enzyme